MIDTDNLLNPGRWFDNKKPLRNYIRRSKWQAVICNRDFLRQKLNYKFT